MSKAGDAKQEGDNQDDGGKLCKHSPQQAGCQRRSSFIQCPPFPLVKAHIMANEKSPLVQVPSHLTCGKV